MAQKRSVQSSKGRVKSSSTKGTNLKTNAMSKGNKHGALSLERELSKWENFVDNAHAERDEPTALVADAIVIETELSKSNPQSKMSHRAMFLHGARCSLAIWDMLSKPIKSLILNKCFADFMAYQKF